MTSSEADKPIMADYCNAYAGETGELFLKAYSILKKYRIDCQEGETTTVSI